MIKSISHARAVVSSALHPKIGEMKALVSSYESKLVQQQRLSRRAVEAAVWGMPIVSTDAMRQAFFRDAGAAYNDIVFWSQQVSWKLQVTTPDASSCYAYIPFNTRLGPLVVEIPPAEGVGLFGSFNDAWQAPQVDIGPTGEDEGRGDKYLLLPPNYDGPVALGAIPVRFATYNGYCFLHAVPATAAPEDAAKALAVLKQARIYRLEEAGNPPPQRYIDMSDKVFDGIVCYDDSFYDSLARMINEEPVQLRDHVAMGQLATLGIEKGKPFSPDVPTRYLLTKAVTEAHAGFVQDMMAGAPYWTGGHWTTPGMQEAAASFGLQDRVALDARAKMFYLSCGPAKKHGVASTYLLGVTDAQAVPLQGDYHYRLHVPAGVPARQFWAVTVYDLSTAAFIRKVERVEINSYEQMQKNPDGSVDIYFGPKAPAGKQSNWIPTEGAERWFALFRFYGPEPALHEKRWELNDIESLNN